MAFQGIGDVAGSIGDLGKVINTIGSISSGFEKMGKTMYGAHKWQKNVTGELKKGIKSEKKWARGLSAVQENVGNSISLMSGLGAGALASFGLLMQLGEAMGIMQPLMQFLTAIFQIMGATAMEALLPALQKLFALLSDPNFMKFLEDMGKMIGNFFKLMIEAFVEMFKDPKMQEMIKFFLKIFLTFLKVLMSILAVFFGFLSGLELPALLAVLVLLAGVIGFFYGFAHGGPIMGAIMGTIAAVAMGVIGAIAIATMAEGGIVNRPTLALIGEAGPEAVIPLSGNNAGMDNDEVVWALENNTKRLDTLIYMKHQSSRRRRLK